MNIGDRLLVTQEYVDWYKTVNEFPVLNFEINEELTVLGITENGKVRVVSGSGAQVGVGAFLDYEMAKKMRDAYKNQITDIDEMERRSYIRRNRGIHDLEHNTSE